MFFVLFYSIVLSIVCHSTTTTTTTISVFEKENIEKKTIENANNNNNNKFYIYVYVYMCLFCVFGRRMCFFCSLEYGHNDDKSKNVDRQKANRKQKQACCLFYIVSIILRGCISSLLVSLLLIWQSTKCEKLFLFLGIQSNLVK